MTIIRSIFWFLCIASSICLLTMVLRVPFPVLINSDRINRSSIQISTGDPALSRRRWQCRPSCYLLSSNPLNQIKPGAVSGYDSKNETLPQPFPAFGPWRYPDTARSKCNCLCGILWVHSNHIFTVCHYLSLPHGNHYRVVFLGYRRRYGHWKQLQWQIPGLGL